MRQKIAAGNWKMFKTRQESIEFMEELTKHNIPGDVKCIIAPPYLYLNELTNLAKGHERIHLSAQNCHEAKDGAYTGEISAPMLKSIGVPYVIIGHSERREQHCETHEMLKDKVLAALENDLKPIFCCGEPLEVRKSKEHIAHVTEQLTNSLKGLSDSQMSNLVVAYEPIWAIGTGLTASPAEAQEMHKAIREHLRDLFNDEIAEAMPILYGGSVKPSNAKELFSNADVDGGLVGGASLDAKSFSEIINAF
jgi:triosephosphate isomerase